MSTFTNKVIKTEENEFTLITFAFLKKEEAEFIQVRSRKKKKFFSFSNLLNLGIDYLLGRFKNIGIGLKGVMDRVELFKYFSMGI